MLWLNGEIGPGAGDVAGGNDFGPTDTEVTLLQDLEHELGAVEPEYRALMEQHLPAFNRAMLERGAVPVAPAAESAVKTAAEPNQ